MLTAEEIMTREVATLSPGTSITEAARLLLETGFNGMPVVDEGERVVGILCQSDLIVQQKKIPFPSVFTVLDSFIPLKPSREVEKALQRIAATTVRDAMTRNPITVRPETGVEELAALMVDKSFHTLPVVNQMGKLVGIIGKKDMLKTLFQSPEKGPGEGRLPGETVGE